MENLTNKIDNGTYGTVYKVENEDDGNILAIKLFEFKSNECKIFMTIEFLNQTGLHQDQIDVKYVLREVEAMMKVKGERIVRYFDSWMDSKDNIYIQMEFCSNNLKNILQNWKKFFPKPYSHSMNRIEYHICCQIFIELLEAVDYLHQ